MTTTNLSAACLALFASAVWGQPYLSLPVDLPLERGIYYRVDGSWESLSRTLFMPMVHGETLSFMNLGERGSHVEIPGPQALVRTGNAQPTFYVRGFSPADGLHLVRAKSEHEYRDVKLRVDRHISDGPTFRSQDLYQFDANGVSSDVFTLTPHGNLPPGEYVIVPAVEAGYRWIQFAYGFGVPRGAGVP